MPHIILDDRKLISFVGPDATHLLHNVLTCNVETLEKGVAQIGALLTPQGKIMFDFFISKNADDAFTIDIDTAQAAAFVQRMTMYRLRSKVEITELSESLVSVSWGNDSPAISNALKDTRFKGCDVFRTHEASAPTENRSDWDALRIEYGVPEPGLDYALGDVFPHDVSFDQNGGVDFKKGCYIGQEVVSRMHHRHTARRRILIAKGAIDGSVTALTADDKPVGTIGTIVGDHALCLCRIDRVGRAIKSGHFILLGDAEVEISIPPHVTYDWPDEADDA